LRLWTLATAATYPLVVIALFLFALAHNIPPNSDPEFAHRATATLTLSIVYAPVGIGQWLLLRRVFRRAGLWIAVSYAGWLLAFLAFLLSERIGLSLLPFGTLALPLLIGIMGAIQAAATGVLLLALEPHRPLLPGA
jgi:hypothetical protein